MHVRILDKYIFREVCKAFLFGICAFSAVFIGSKIRQRRHKLMQQIAVSRMDF